jgi:hypothetical protein
MVQVISPQQCSCAEEIQIDNTNYFGTCLILKIFDRSRSAQSWCWQQNLSVVGGIAGSAGKVFWFALTPLQTKPSLCKGDNSSNKINCREKEAKREGQRKKETT